jgi:hypothetical protein
MMFFLTNHVGIKNISIPYSDNPPEFPVGGVYAKCVNLMGQKFLIKCEQNIIFSLF